MTPTFLLTSLVIVATPGTGVLYTVAAGLGRGRRAGVLAALACTVGILPHLVAGVSGLAVVLHASPFLYRALLWAGIGYLLFMAWGTWRNGAPTPAEGSRRDAGVLRDGVLLNLLNPKLTLFFLAFLPQFSGGDLATALRLGGVFTLLSALVFVGYGLGAASLGPALDRHPRWVRNTGRVFALCYVVLAVGLLLRH